MFYFKNMDFLLTGKYNCIPYSHSDVGCTLNIDDKGLFINIRNRLYAELVNKQSNKEDLGNNKGEKKNKQKILKVAKQEAQYFLEDPDFENYFFYE